MSDILMHSNQTLEAGHQVLLRVTPERAGWDSIDFSVHRVPEGVEWIDRTGDCEACLVLLQGELQVEWKGGKAILGPRDSVFASYPHAVYLPRQTGFRVTGVRSSEVADGRAPSRMDGRPQIIRPEQCGFEIRGGGNATRQIVDILPPEFPAERLLACEVFTPAGNWSSFPPHKHDADNYPLEVDLDEVYYYRFSRPEGFGFQRVYSADGSRDETLRVTGGDLVLIRDGYHPFVTSYGYDAYYLNFLAGDGRHRSMAGSDDPAYAHLKENWPAPDPRLPLLERPVAELQPELESPSRAE